MGAAEVAEATAVQVAAARARLRALRARPPSALCTVSCATCPVIAVTVCRTMAALACRWSSDVIEGAPPSAGAPESCHHPWGEACWPKTLARPCCVAFP